MPPRRSVALTVVQGTPAPGVGDFHLTDLGNAKRFVARHGDDLRYCHPWNRWLVFDGQPWRDDDTAEAERRLKETLEDLEQEAFGLADGGERRKLLQFVWASERAARIRGALELARSEPRIPVRPDELDGDPLLFNVENGTIQLDAGELSPHRREDLVTKLARVVFDPDATAPTWEAFLERVQPDEATRSFLQRAVGYSMAAETGEQVLLILWGSGANGKTTFVEAIRSLLGDYGQQAPTETFLDRREGIPNDVARLRGARFVAATEISEGRRLNEALVKRMTGGDTLVARFMRAEFFEFKPTFTLWLVTNHRPEIRGTDEAIWRRIRLIPWEVTIAPDERDHDLPDKLRRELPGILNWALAGFAQWRDTGLNPPDRVLTATSDYRADSDVIGRFVEECCETVAGATVGKGELYTRFEYWAGKYGEEKLTQTAFGTRMKERGFTDGRTGTKGRYWAGLRILREEGDV